MPPVLTQRVGGRPGGPLAAAALALALTLARPAAAEPFACNDTTWEGSSELLDLARARLGHARVEVAATLDYATLAPGDGILVLHPEVDLDYDALAAFLRAGGRVAVLDDHGSSTGLLERFDIRRIPPPLRPAYALRRNAALAVAVPAIQVVAGEEQSRHPVVAKVEQLVTNHPSAFRHPSLTPVLEIPAVGEPAAALAVTGIIAERGRLLAMGDPSAVINLMLRYPGNRAFAEGLVDYLVEDDTWGKRSGRLFIVTGGFRQRGQFGDDGGWRGRLADSLDGLGDLADDVRRDGLPELASLALAVAAAAGALAWAATSATRTYRRVAPRYARGTPLEAQGGLAGRLAVLEAPTTSPALGLLELRTALLEAIVARTGLEPFTAQETLLAELDRQGALPAASSRALRSMLSELHRAESAVAAGLPLRLSARDRERLHREFMALVAELDHHGAPR